MINKKYVSYNRKILIYNIENHFKYSYVRNVWTHIFFSLCSYFKFRPITEFHFNEKSKYYKIRFPFQRTTKLVTLVNKQTYDNLYGSCVYIIFLFVVITHGKYNRDELKTEFWDYTMSLTKVIRLCWFKVNLH